MNKILIDSEIYGENTLKQILGGKDTKMTAEAHTTLYLVFSRVFINNRYNRSPGKLQKYLPDNLKEHADDLKKISEENGILELL